MVIPIHNSVTPQKNVYGIERENISGEKRTALKEN